MLLDPSPQTERANEGMFCWEGIYFRRKCLRENLIKPFHFTFTGNHSFFFFVPLLRSRTSVILTGLYKYNKSLFGFCIKMSYFLGVIQLFLRLEIICPACWNISPRKRAAKKWKFGSLSTQPRADGKMGLNQQNVSGVLEKNKTFRSSLPKEKNLKELVVRLTMKCLLIQTNTTKSASSILHHLQIKRV